MSINENCIREILKFLIESNNVLCFPNQFFRYESFSAIEIHNNIPQFELNDVLYSLKILNEAGFITGHNLKAYDIAKDSNNVIVYDVTYRGHSFYNSIKPENVWKKTKNIVNKVGVHTLNFIEDTAQKIAVNSATALITTALNPNSPK